MARKRVQRCMQCRALLPKEAGTRRRYCGTTCRSWHWRRVQRHEEIYRRVLASLSQELVRGGVVWGQGRCPECGLTVSVYCSPKCRARAWRLRRETADSGP
ncbi:hypothetical protein OHA02_51610 [Streptomyces phaeochromogenes]|nr:hypothetical protein [Streptomyces phaeochromogenes]